MSLAISRDGVAKITFSNKIAPQEISDINQVMKLEAIKFSEETYELDCSLLDW